MSEESAFVNGEDKGCYLRSESWVDFRADGRLAIERNADTNRGVNELLSKTKELSPMLTEVKSSVDNLRTDVVKLLKFAVATLAVGFLAQIVIALVHDKPIDIKTNYGEIVQHTTPGLK